MSWSSPRYADLIRTPPVHSCRFQPRGRHNAEVGIIVEAQRRESGRDHKQPGADDGEDRPPGSLAYPTGSLALHHFREARQARSRLYAGLAAEVAASSYSTE